MNRHIAEIRRRLAEQRRQLHRHHEQRQLISETTTNRTVLIRASVSRAYRP